MEICKIFQREEGDLRDRSLSPQRRWEMEWSQQTWVFPLEEAQLVWGRAVGWGALFCISPGSRLLTPPVRAREQGICKKREL